MDKGKQENQNQKENEHGKGNKRKPNHEQQMTINQLKTQRENTVEDNM